MASVVANRVLGKPRHTGRRGILSAAPPIRRPPSVAIAAGFAGDDSSRRDSPQPPPLAFYGFDSASLFPERRVPMSHSPSAATADRKQPSYAYRVDIINDNNGRRVRGRPGMTRKEALRNADFFSTRGSLRAVVVRCACRCGRSTATVEDTALFDVLLIEQQFGKGRKGRLTATITVEHRGMTLGEARAFVDRFNAGELANPIGAYAVIRPSGAVTDASEAGKAVRA